MPTLDDHLGIIADGARRLAGLRDLAEAAAIAADTAAELTGAARARCRFVHGEAALLWTFDGEEFPITAGICGAAARTREVQIARIARAHPAYVREIDDPEGTGTEQVLAQPIVAPTGEVHAVLLVVREASRPTFAELDLESIAFWAQQCGPSLHLLHVIGLADDRHDAAGVVGPRLLYREEALESWAADDEMGALLDASPAWLRHSHLLAFIVIVASALFIGFVHVTEYTEGPAFVVSRARRDVVAPRAGVLAEVFVKRGDEVTKGDVVATLTTDNERAGLVHAQAELERAEVARLHDPSDRALELDVARAVAGLASARAHLEGGHVRATASGYVADLRVDSGRALEPGQVVMTIRHHTEDDTIVRALIPGRARPVLEVGQRLTLELDGFSDADLDLRVTAVSDEVLGIGEIQRVVGPDLGDVLAIHGPVVVVETRLASPLLETYDGTWTLHDGMVGKVEIPIRSKRLVFALFPSLEGGLDRG